MGHRPYLLCYLFYPSTLQNIVWHILGLPMFAERWHSGRVSSRAVCLFPVSLPGSRSRHGGFEGAKERSDVVRTLCPGPLSL